MDQLDILNPPNTNPSLPSETSPIVTPATPSPEPQSQQQNSGKPPVSEARLRANRRNAKRSSGPKTDEGKKRSSLNAMRHGILAQTIHLPEEEMLAYSEFTSAYVADLSPTGAVETQLAHACADLQFRLHRLAAAEHNLFAIGHAENGDQWVTERSESHSALTFAETIRRTPDPVATLTLYETRLSRRFLQTLKQLREMQAQRHAIESQQLEEMYLMACHHPQVADSLEPTDLGFVCSSSHWKLFWRRKQLTDLPAHPSKRSNSPQQQRQSLLKTA